MSISIIKAVRDTNLLRSFLEDENGKVGSWLQWFTVLRAIYGLKIHSKRAELFRDITGRSISHLPADGFKTALLLVGRRGGKSKVAAAIAAFESCLGGREKKLSAGEMGLVSVVSPTKLQSQIIKTYIRAALSSPLLEQEIVRENRDGFQLDNRVRIQILVGDFRSVRGFTQLTVIADEICFLGLTEESKVRNDSELIQAIRPALLTTNGKLIAISTKYSKKGWAYRTWKNNFANDAGKILVVDAPSITMNPTLSQEAIDEIIAEDPIAGRTEFLNQWREDISAYLPRETIESVVKKGRLELLPKSDILYFGFVDVSGGRNESSAISVAHKSVENEKIIVDFLKEFKAPHNPTQVIRQMSDRLKRFKIRKVVGDNYSGEFSASAFRSCGISYEKSSLPKSSLYLELLPTICSNKIELLDNETAISQLSSLERRTRSGGRDIVDHPQGQHDDLANAIAGVNFVIGKPCVRAGAL